MKGFKYWSGMPREDVKGTTLGGVQDSVRHSPEKPALLRSALSCGLDYKTSGGPSQLKLFYGWMIHQIRMLLLAMQGCTHRSEADKQYSK